MTDEQVQRVVLPTADDLVADVVLRAAGVIGAALDLRERAAIALTAGSIMESVWAALAASPGAAALDWSRVDVFWGDERFVPDGAPDRNDAPAEKLLFGAEPFSSATRYSMPPSDGEFGDDLAAAADGYARTLAAHAAGGIDLVLLGVGPDGHCCSLFPDHPSARDETGTVIAVTGSPKPPPERISLSFAGLNAARAIFVVVSGDGKAEAARKALSGEYTREQIPSGGARGVDQTVWFLDADAAAELS